MSDPNSTSDATRTGPGGGPPKVPGFTPVPGAEVQPVIGPFSLT